MFKCETHMHTRHDNLYVANDPGFGACSLVGNPFPVAAPHSWILQSRGPWLPGRLCCPARSRLTMTSSDPLDSFRRLICFVQAALCPTVSFRLVSRGSPIYSARLFHRATSGTPVLRSVTNDCSTADRTSFRHLRKGSASTFCARRFSRSLRNEATSSSLSLRPDGLLALLRQGRLRSSFRFLGSPPESVEYNYTANSQFRGRTFTGKTRSIMGCGRRRREEKFEGYCA
jgi:hypothetical protein